MGVTPFEAFIGRPARLPIDLILPTLGKKYETQMEYIQDTMVRFEKMYDWILEGTEAQFQRMPELTQETKSSIKKVTKYSASSKVSYRGSQARSRMLG